MAGNESSAAHTDSRDRTLATLGGEHCGRCGKFLPFGRAHSCPDRVTVALERIADALARRSPAAPTISEVYDELREEYDALGMLSYTGGQADLPREDIDKIRALLRRTAAAIEGLS